MTRGWPTTSDEAITEACYYGRNFAPKASLDEEECVQEAMIAAWTWWERGKRKSDLWHAVSRDLWDYARRINGRKSRALHAQA